jgi:hypothetical protein
MVRNPGMEFAPSGKSTKRSLQLHRSVPVNHLCATPVSSHLHAAPRFFVQRVVFVAHWLKFSCMSSVAPNDV